MPKHDNIENTEQLQSPQSQPKQQQPEQPEPSSFEAIMRSAAQNVSFGYADEMAAAMDAAKTIASTDTFSMDDFDELYESAKKRIRGLDQKAREAHPGLSVATDIATSVVVPGAALKVLPKAAKAAEVVAKGTRAQRAAKGAGLGAGLSGVESVGRQEEVDISDTLINMGLGGITAGILSGATSPKKFERIKEQITANKAAILNLDAATKKQLKQKGLDLDSVLTGEMMEQAFGQQKGMAKEYVEQVSRLKRATGKDYEKALNALQKKIDQTEGLEIDLSKIAENSVENLKKSFERVGELSEEQAGKLRILNARSQKLLQQASRAKNPIDKELLEEQALKVKRDALLLNKYGDNIGDIKELDRLDREVKGVIEENKLSELSKIKEHLRQYINRWEDKDPKKKIAQKVTSELQGTFDEAAAQIDSLLGQTQRGKRLDYDKWRMVEERVKDALDKERKEVGATLDSPIKALANVFTAVKYRIIGPLVGTPRKDLTKTIQRGISLQEKMKRAKEAPLKQAILGARFPREKGDE